MMEIVLVVNSVRGRPGRFSGRVGGSIVVKSSKTPLLSATRKLLESLVAKAGDIVVMRHEGSAVDAMRARVDAAAKLRVDEEGPRFAKWKPHYFEDAKRR